MSLGSMQIQTAGGGLQVAPARDGFASTSEVKIPGEEKETHLQPPSQLEPRNR